MFIALVKRSSLKKNSHVAVMMCPRCGIRITNVRLEYKKQIGWRQTLSLRCFQPLSYYKESYFM